MDAYISRRASTELKAAVLLYAEKDRIGFLIGHKRGHRYFVESIIHSYSDSLFTENIFFTLNDLFADKIIGFFSLSTNKDKRNIFFNPLGVGKLLIDIHPGEKSIFKLKSFQIDYEGRYQLKPIELSLKEIKV